VRLDNFIVAFGSPGRLIVDLVGDLSSLNWIGNLLAISFARAVSPLVTAFQAAF